MIVKMVTAQLERLKLSTYQSQKRVPFPFPTMNPHFLSLPSWDSRLPSRPHSHTVHCRRSRARDLSALTWTLPPGKPEKGWFLSPFVPPFPVGQTNELGACGESPASLQSQETWPLLSSLRNTQWVKFTQCKFGIHPFKPSMPTLCIHLAHEVSSFIKRKNRCLATQLL